MTTPVRRCALAIGFAAALAAAPSPAATPLLAVGPVAKFIVSGIPASVTAGTAATVTVDARDAANVRVTNYTGTIHFSSTDSKAVLPLDYTFKGTTDAGVHTFTNGVTLKTSGAQSVTATDTVTASVTGSQTGITVNPGAAATLAVRLD